ncbi:alpha/beta hydrolase [Solirubrobacter phytolaccae]|uniref:Alpha/beta hydrolase n=1 Tax=Solirubrobacter phytolaccae TaxID=1404360 RepID=A0A9X3N460_9ACTN|nr:alpha/beta hydrolase [Solirubrobacter phytolaccae]MDA0179294.1 alpha/beta hydrolase [Solirubrobacter phytolaccae]
MTIEPFEHRGSRGRVLSARTPGAPPGSILLIYGHHADLERMRTIAVALSALGTVTCPDLPGFGGMPPVRENRVTTIDGLADALAAAIGQCCDQRERFSIVAVSFGLVVAIRALERHPHLVPRVSAVVSLAGLAERADLRLPRRLRTPARMVIRAAATAPVAGLTARWLLQSPLLEALCRNFARHEHDAVSLAAEVRLWRSGDWRTRLLTLAEILRRGRPPTSPLPVLVHHVASANDRYVHPLRTVRTLEARFREVRFSVVAADRHIPSATADLAALTAFLPDAALEVLRRHHADAERR